MEALKNTFLIVLGITVLLIAASGCLGQEKATGNVSSAVVERKTVKIGAPLTLTGKAADYGFGIKSGFEIALEELEKENKKFRLEFIFEDTQSDVEPAVNAVKKLLEIDGVKILLGFTRSNDVLAAAPLTEAKKAILFTPIASAEEITNAGDFVFRNRESGTEHGKRLAEFLKGRGIRKVAVFAAQSANSITYSKAFTESFKAKEGDIVFSAQYNENSTDFKSEISKALEERPEAFFVAAALSKDATLVVKQLKELGFNDLVVGSATLDSQDFLQSAGKAAEGIVTTSPFFDDESPKAKEFNEKYRQKFGREPSFWSANSYDAVKIVYNAIEKCNGDENTECIRDYLYSVKNYPGIGGLTSFDKHGDVIKPVMLKTVKNGKFEVLED